MDGIEEDLAKIKRKIAEYERKDVYNMDETALFYNLSPDTTIAREQIEGSKKDKTRITIAFTCNADGSDRLQLFSLDMPKSHGVLKKTGEELGYFYLNNQKAWMTGEFFQTYLRRLNNHVSRKILLLIDNAPSHIWDGLELSNIEIIRLPPNTTSKLQPLDAGIIAAFKRHYRRSQISYALDLLDAGKNPYKVDQLQAMRWAAEAWNNLDKSVIINCWRHTGILSTDDDSTPRPIDPVLQDPNYTAFITEFDHFIQTLNIQHPMSPEEFVSPAPEESNAHELLTDEEILQAAQIVDEDGDQEEAENNPPLPYVDLPKQEKVIILAKAIAIVEAERENWQETHAGIRLFRNVQRDLRWSIMEEKQQNLKQTSIMQFFDRH